MRMKYIIFDDCFPVIFASAISHDQMAKVNGPFGPMHPTSAGFVDIANSKAVCSGGSVSLNILSHASDSGLINHIMMGE